MTTPPGDPLTYAIIGAAIDVHAELGPVVLEAAFEECLCFELQLRGLAFRRQVGLPVIYKGHRLDLGYRPDLIIENRVIVELKRVEKLLPLHDAQLLTYLRLTGVQIGLLINIQETKLVNGIKRFIHSSSDCAAASASTSRPA